MEDGLGGHSRAPGKVSLGRHHSAEVRPSKHYKPGAGRSRTQDGLVEEVLDRQTASAGLLAHQMPCEVAEAAGRRRLQRWTTCVPRTWVESATGPLAAHDTPVGDIVT